MLVHLPRFVQNSSVLTKSTAVPNKFRSRLFSRSATLLEELQDVVNRRQSEASRSIVVQVASEKSFDDVHKYCSQYGKITKAFFYTVPKNGSSILLEFDNNAAVDEVFRSTAFPALASGVTPVKSSFLWFRNTAKNKKLKPVKSGVTLNTREKTVEMKTSELANRLKEATSVSDQINILYENTRLNDLSIRLRFLGALQIQNALSGLFLNHTVLPFGSTVNGFGKLGCDLDMILHYNTDDLSYKAANDYDERRLMFHTKGCVSDTDTTRRGFIANHIKFYGSMCESFIPGAVNVSPIATARVPIVRYSHSYLDISVDISLLNMTGFYISELFHIFGEIDDRVRPLVFLVRRWAKEIQLIAKNRTNTITNFQITCLVLSFLQQLSQPILPVVPELVRQARKIDARHTDSNRNYTFLRDIKQLQFKTQNTTSTEELFNRFLEFYGSFEYAKYSISLHSGKPIRKIEVSPLQIANPFELEQNWSRNVIMGECHALKMHAQETLADLMDENCSKAANKERWGLLSIFPNLK